MKNMAAKMEKRKAREGIYSGGGGHAGGWRDNKTKKAGRDGDGEARVPHPLRTFCLLS